MVRRVAVIDNYDSFTYNLVQYLEILGAQCQVYLNDRVSVDSLEQTAPDGVLISPGPGTPEDAGISLEVIHKLGSKIPIFGVCLGHQAIGQAFGGRVVRAQQLMHGKTSEIYHSGVGVFAELPSPFEATRYHSLLVEAESLPSCLEVTARTASGEVMGIRHRSQRIEGVQFHPESILTERGLRLVQNWLEAL